jgi:uncharacterized coiled-coil protein SlyX
MNASIDLKTTPSPLLIIFALALACVALWPAPNVFGVSLAPDGDDRGYNTAVGKWALFSVTTGIDNAALGYQALYYNTAGSYNTGTGFRALFSNTNGTKNTATGMNALISNTTGNFNTANGGSALRLNRTGSHNTAVGINALFANTVSNNTALGDSALLSNTTGINNTAAGYQALYNNTDGERHVAVGFQALYNNKSGSYNNAVGAYALYNNKYSFDNNAFGDAALYNCTGHKNTAIGDSAGLALTNGGGNVCIGATVYGVAGESNTTRIRNISSTVQDTGLYVTLDAMNGTKLGCAAQVSSRRFKDDIKPINESSEAIFALKPVNFRYKPEVNPDRARRFGLIAEEVEKINPDLVAQDSEGKPLTVRYESINAMLLNEFLKEHKKVEQQQANIARLRSTVANQETTINRLRQEMAGLAATLKTQASQIRKVSDEIELRKAPPQTALNN